MMGIERGMNIKCVGGGHIEGTVMVANNTYNSYHELNDLQTVLNQFKGKTIGTPTRGFIHDVIIRSMVKDMDITIKNYTWADFIPDAILDQEIAAGVGTPSLATVASIDRFQNTNTPKRTLAIQSQLWNSSTGGSDSEKMKVYNELSKGS